MPNIDAQKTPAPRDWHRADIKAALEKNGSSLTHISRLNGYARSSAGAALRIQWPKMEQLIAAAIGREPSEIWPSRYDENGQPKPRPQTGRLKRTLKNTTGVSRGNVHAQGVNRHGARQR